MQNLRDKVISGTTRENDLLFDICWMMLILSCVMLPINLFVLMFHNTANVHVNDIIHAIVLER